MNINQAVILAGGIGSRTKTRVYDNNTPKVMFRINNKPILQNIHSLARWHMLMKTDRLC